MRTDPSETLLGRPGSPMTTSSSAAGTGSGRSRSASINVKMAVLAPIPTASDSTTTKAKPRLWRSARPAYTRVLPQLGEEVGAAHGLLPLGVHGHQLGAHAVPVAELPQRLGAGGGGLHAALDQPPSPHVDMEGELGVHVALDAAGPEAEAEPGHQLGAGAGARSARPATSTNRCQDELPACSRARPARARR